MKTTCFFLIVLSLCTGMVRAQETAAADVATPDSRSSLLRVEAGYNVLGHHPHVGGMLQLGYEVSLPVRRVNLALGAQLGMYHAYDLREWWSGFHSTVFEADTHITPINLYLGWLPLCKEHHRLLVGAGYSFAALVNVPEKPRTLYLDHGLLVRAGYDYVYDSGFFIGGQVQYTRYFVHSVTPDLLTVGVSLGVRFK